MPTPVVQNTVRHLPAELELPAEGSLHLWSVATLKETDPTAELKTLLSSEEQARAQRYVTPMARRQFVESRGLLRLLLGAYLRQDPSRLEFIYSDRGKPFLTQERGGANLQFNVSHSRGRLIYAVSVGFEVGIDLEGVNPLLNCLDIARRICTPDEWFAFSRLSPVDRHQAFYKIWTRKEALVKLRGDRLYEKLTVFEVPVHPTSDGCWVQAEGRPVWLQDLELFESFATAIAFPVIPAQIVHHEWHYVEDRA
ncbi:4'-phosphopantetheinyl transferase family protein [Altericista sp. CCNU0014]|uniref:4'-phosphopantetheinyl transferase family protein n=1 Tax=Altericista sp. CCNU0014 TaxID=3082949 RepID=UPI003850BE0D